MKLPTFAYLFCFGAYGIVAGYLYVRISFCICSCAELISSEVAEGPRSVI